MIIAPEAKHLAFMSDLKVLLRKYGDTLSAQEVLALASQLVGNLIALQDQRKVTPEMAMALVASNIEIGNRTVIDGLLDTKGNG